MNVTSFAKGDKKSLKRLLEKNMFARFSEVIDERKIKQIKSETTFIGIKSAKVAEFKKIENVRILLFFRDFLFILTVCLL